MECDAPQTFGVHGDWGAGKTSFLRQLRYHLDGSKDACRGGVNADLGGGVYEGATVTIWFDAWRYQHEPTPVIALLHEIRRQFGTWAKARKKFAKLGEVTFLSVLNSLDDVAKLVKLEAVPFSPKSIKDVGERWEKEHLEGRMGVDTVQDFLEDAVETILKSLLPRGVNGRLVIFIDDLDRCSADSAFRLLEGLKVYLSLKNCVFVIGMNQQLVVDAIASCMPKELTPVDAKLKEAAVRVRAEAYLEKLCTDIERLTPPSDTRTLMCSWIDEPEFVGHLSNALTSAAGEAIRCLSPNPRRLKALANVLLKWWPRVKGLEGEQVRNVRGLVVLAYVYQFHSELFQRWQFNPAFFTHMVNWSTKVWPLTEQGLTQDWPSYFSGLRLPEQSYIGSESEPVPIVMTRSTFPDPYSPDMFWIAPLLREAGLTEDVMHPIMDAVTSHNH